MKKNLLALSIAAMVGGLSGVANAQSVVTDTLGGRVISNAVAFGKLAAPAAPANNLAVTPSGVGHVLFVPYFTTQGSHMTLLNLVNTDEVNGKAVKLRFRGAANSDDLFDISIFLSPGDVWTAAVTADGAVSAISTGDTTCTLPSAAQIKETKGRFLTSRVLNNDPAETREGYVEILNMADIVPGTALFTAVKHVAGKAPCTPAVMDLQAKELVANDATHDPVNRGYSWPTGGLSANWTLVDTVQKASFSGEAVALKANGAANLVFSPQTTARVPDAQVAFLTADPLLRMINGPVRAASYDFPDLSTPYTAVNPLFGGSPEAQATVLSDALAVTSLSNEFITDPNASFATDWVFSMPTRRYAVALNYEAKAMVFNPGVAKHFTLENTSLNKEKTRICVDAPQLKAYDREETSRTTFVISPSESLKFCGETSVLSFNGKASVLGAKVAQTNIDTTFVDGWMSVSNLGLWNATTRTYGGLPVMGFAAAKAVGADASNFGGTWMHRTSK